VRPPAAGPPEGRLLGWAAAAAVVSALLGALLLTVVLPARGPTPLDLKVRALAASSRTPARTAAARLLTVFGGLPFLAAAGAALLAYCVRAARRRAAAFSALTLLGGFAAEQAIKFAVRRPRPGPHGFLTAAFGYSFPSGHSMMSTVLYGLLAALVARGERKKAVKGATIAVFAILILLVGASRVYLAVHWATDVLFGFCAGLFWLSAAGAASVAFAAASKSALRDGPGSAGKRPG
jgi:undecaprenyl-diphosphatase